MMWGKSRMDKMQRLLAIWWIRILSTGALTGIFYLIYISVTGVNNSIIAYCLPIFLASVIVEHYRKNSIFYLFGIMINLSTPKEFLFGLSLAMGNMIVLAIFAYFYSDTIITKLLINSDWYLVFFTTFFAAGFEEIVFRGVLFQSFNEYFGKYLSTIIFAFIFAIAHLQVDSVASIFFLNLFIAGILFNIMYLQTKSLWLSISFHFFWNLLEQVLLGSPVSGNEVSFVFINFNTVKLPEVLFGGFYGIEGGIIATVLLLINIVVVLKYANPSPYISSLLFKRYYAESEIIYKRDKGLA